MTEEKDATQNKRVSDDELTEEEKEKKLAEGRASFASIRGSTIDSILDARNEEFEKETGQKLTEETEGDSGDNETEEEKGEEESKEKTGDQSDQEEMIEIVVDGEKKEYPKSQVDKHGGQVAFQKELAADRRLELANKKLKELEEKEKVLTEKTQKTGGLSDKDADKTGSDTGDDDIEKLIAEKRKAYLYALQYEDDDDEIEKALKEYEDAKEGRQWATPAGGEVDINEAVERALTVREIRNKFYSPPDEGGFGDLTEDPDIFEIVTNRINKAIANGEPGEKWETYEKAGNEIRERFSKLFGGGEKKPTESTTSTHSLDSKKERKREATAKQVDSINKRFGSDASKQDEDENAARIKAIEEIRRARPGQQFY